MIEPDREQFKRVPSGHQTRAGQRENEQSRVESSRDEPESVDVRSSKQNESVCSRRPVAEESPLLLLQL